MRKLGQFLFAVLVFLSVFWTIDFFLSPASSQSLVCGERRSIVAQLERKYGETRRAIGLQQGRGVVEVYASEKTGSWTILVTNTRGQSCLMAAGEAFEAMRAAEIDPAEPL